MKNLLLLGSLFLSFNVYANTFRPVSGMVFSCEDSVSSYVYTLKIVDLGDQDAEVIVSDRGHLHKLRDAGFFEYDKGSYFTVSSKKLGNFNIQIPGNDLDEAYIVDSADSRALDCNIVK